jgi:hypothetical protein
VKERQSSDGNSSVNRTGCVGVLKGKEAAYTLGCKICHRIRLRKFKKYGIEWVTLLAMLMIAMCVPEI